MSADYSQIGLRVLAHMSNSKTLIDAFNSGLDIHAETAKKVFNKELLLMKSGGELRLLTLELFMELVPLVYLKILRFQDGWLKNLLINIS